MNDLTDRQAAVLDFICRHVEEKQRPPTIRDLMTHLGISSPNGVTCHIQALVKKGALKRSRNVSRGLTPTPQAPIVYRNDDKVVIRFPGEMKRALDAREAMKLAQSLTEAAHG